ncbi:TPA: hypothetical protein DIV48_00900 [Candidatus Kaiserbacteria bacterium]|nr:hypothetical protein [Candidatus Kaiserbacteria bacterium]
MEASALDSALRHSIDLSLPGKRAAESGSVAVSQTGALYPAGCLGSETHLLNISSELAALVRAVHADDVHIERILTVVSDARTPVSPLVLKILADHGTRTGTPISYTVCDLLGTVLFEVADAREALPFYKGPGMVLKAFADRAVQTRRVALDRTSAVSPELQLRTWALAGCDRNFPTRDGASGYGAALLTASGNIYYGGQYSTFEHRLGVHAEMGVLLNALMDGAKDITHLGLVSTKSPDTPCSPCGCCRQFVGELSRAFDFSPAMCLFASGNETYTSHTIEELLPIQWTNKNDHRR